MAASKEATRCESLDQRLTPGTRIEITHPMSDLEKQLAGWETTFVFDLWAYNGIGHYAVISEEENQLGYLVHPESLSLL